MTHHHVNTGSLWNIGCVHFTALPASDCEFEARLSDCKIINNGGFNTLPPPLYCKISRCSFFNGPERTYCSCGRGVQVDDASYVRAHWINGGVRSKPKVVDAQIGGALIHHLTDHVHFHLQKQNNSTNDFQRTLISTVLLKTAIHRSCRVFGYTKVCKWNITPSITCVYAFHIWMPSAKIKSGSWTCKPPFKWLRLKTTNKQKTTTTRGLLWVNCFLI